jgi:hypothetical protein
MSHFKLEEWADFVRDVAKEDQKKAMQSHLDNGCNGCAKLFATWKRVQEAGRRESSYQPPESIVRSVKGAGVIHGLPTAHPEKAPIAELLFDSMRSPMAAGVRSNSAVLRQLLYGVGGYRLDLRIEPQENSDKVDLLGQVLNSTDPDKPIGVTPIVLKRGNKVLAESVTNRFGEFQLECDLEGSLQLQADLPHGQVVQIPLVELVSPTSDGKPQPDDSIGLKRLLRRVEKRTRKKV